MTCHGTDGKVLQGLDLLAS